ncbi:MAG: DUF3825 domain-containing protein [Atopobiaceae bacterium]|nr:DUF3825 domain-containing protein [Atopobiaceae bacterium]
MAKVTPGFKLYLYQLLSRKLGFGKQTLLPQVEEVLAEDDIIAQDLECDTIQEVVEACPDFLKVTVFKKGRVYATVLRNEEWDQMLAAPPEKVEKSGKKAAGGPKTWKKKKGGKKALKPVKPGKHRHEREAAEAAARAEAEAERAEAAALEAAQAEATATEDARAESPDPQVTDEPPTAETEVEASADDTPSEPETPVDRPTSDGIVARTVAEILAESRANEEAAKAAQEETAALRQDPEAAGQEPAAQTTGAPSPAAETQPQGTTEPVPPQPAAAWPEPEPEPEPQVTAPAPPSPEPISLTITYDPYEDMERELAQQRRQETARPRPSEPAPEPAAPAAPSPTIPLQGLPQDFGAEVSCKDALLRSLYQLLPYDVDPMAVLDEDWRMARSTGSLSGSRTRVTFPLRYLHEDGTPITATLRKATKNAFGKQWNLSLVDGDDGTGETHLSVGFEGLPAADEGAWSDLSGTGSADVSSSPVRALTQEVVIGTWDSFLGALANAAAPERWNYPGEGVGKKSRYGILREYVSTNFMRASQQHRIATAEDGSFAAFHTGLMTSLGDDIYACLTKRAGDIPWQFKGFATAGSGELGARLTGTISDLPKPASYLESLSDVTAEHDRMVILDTEAILGRQLGRLPRAFLLERLEDNADARAILGKGSALTSADLTQLARIIKTDASAYRRLRRALDDAVEQAMRAMRASYRLAVPVFDPADGRTKLLAPLSLVEDGKADCALVLDLQPSGAYRAAAILPLARAYACARVISREQPRWLAPDRVLVG